MGVASYSFAMRDHLFFVPHGLLQRLCNLVDIGLEEVEIGAGRAAFLAQRVDVTGLLPP
jgi:hypothetical protein